MLDGSGNVMGHGRSRGLHLGDVLAHMKGVLGQAPVDTGNEAFIKAGFMFEMWVATALSKYVGFDMASRLIEPGECDVDGIFLTPDRVEPDADTLWEFKATWLSMRKLIDLATGEVNVKGLMEHRWAWLIQVMAYARAMGVVKVRIVVMFMNGDYTYKAPNGGPQFRVIELVFTDDELAQNWTMVLNNAADLRKVRKNAAKA